MSDMSPILLQEKPAAETKRQEAPLQRAGKYSQIDQQAPLRVFLQLSRSGSPMAKATPSAASPKSIPDIAPSFEAALHELEVIVQAMEAGEAPLEESLAAYERGMALLRHCQSTLATAERKLQILENGVLRDFDAAGEGGQEG
jgi:exodeoxyribonuclease VII small subunit